MFSVISDHKDFNCQEIDDWTYNSRAIYKIDTQTLSELDKINYAVTSRYTPPVYSPFT